MKILFLLFCAALQAGSLIAAQTVFELDPAKTEITFTLHATVHTVHGTFKLKHGTIRLDSANGKATGEIAIDVASAVTGNGSRDKNMHKEVLETERYPEAIFIPDHVEGQLAPQGKSELDVHGMFRIHGADHEMTLHLQVQGSSGRYNVSAHFTIPYVQWGMKNPSTFLLKVDDKVEVDVRTTI